MGDKRSTHAFRKGLTFQADTPDFLKMLMGGGGPGSSAGSSGAGGAVRHVATLADKRPTERQDDDGDDRPEPEDELPQVELGRGVTRDDAARLLGPSAAASVGSGGSGSGSGSATGDKADEARDPDGGDDAQDDGDDGRVKFRKPRKRARESPAPPAAGKRAAAAATASANADAARERVKRVRDKRLLSFDDADA
ncbi:hypothetical protein HK105_202319 [Polyrhizophydium stewartii]|uniref:DUF4604 domain-containing protein n=1 Tax=Polyrhizophydium stewartii TaxID=2732419 RepID=A0ABR4NEF6_9FUNG|nr:hypothetical protein HK105_003608 [Polyrhizophydium stewartii]